MLEVLWYVYVLR